MGVACLVPKRQNTVRQVTVITERGLLAEEGLEDPRAKNRYEVRSLVETELWRMSDVRYPDAAILLTGPDKQPTQPKALWHARSTLNANQ